MKNVYEEYQIKKVINASGKMTILGGSKVHQEVCEAMAQGASQFYEIKDVLDKTGAYIAQLLNIDSAYIVNSASGGIAQTIAACICYHQPSALLDIYNPTNLKREVVLCKGHNVDYGTAIEVAVSLGGGRVVEAGYANACSNAMLESKITENTVALLYVKSHHCVQKGMPTIEEFIRLGEKYQLPVIIDAAAEEDLTLYYYLGADIVIYSGTKALEGPTSGLLIGKTKWIEEVKLQSKGIGRVMKVGKENILGLTKAISNYVKKDKVTIEEQRERLADFNKQLNSIDGIQACVVQDAAGRAIMRSELTFQTDVLGINALTIAQELKQGDTHIYTRDYRANEGKIEIDIRDVSDEELNQIYQKIVRIIKGTK